MMKSEKFLTGNLAEAYILCKIELSFGFLINYKRKKLFMIERYDGKHLNQVIKHHQ